MDTAQAPHEPTQMRQRFQASHWSRPPRLTHDLPLCWTPASLPTQQLHTQAFTRKIKQRRHNNAYIPVPRKGQNTIFAPEIYS